MKQFLSLSDLATIELLVSREMGDIKHRLLQLRADSMFSEEEKNIQEDSMLNDPFYKNLMHLHNSLLNVTVALDLPDVSADDTDSSSDTVEKTE